MTGAAAAELDNIYNEFAPRLAAMGYHPLPIGPGSKSPHRYMPSEKRFVLFKGWSERPRPLDTPQPGAGIGVRLGAGIVALDYDNDDAAVLISDVMPASPVNKEGQIGFTAFYRCTRHVESENFVNEDGELMVQILSVGRQTVIPPSIHPDTGKPYRWTNGHSLYDTPPVDLPELPEDYRERILALGYKSGGKARAEPEGAREESQTDEDSPFQELNRLAMRNMERWVPDLGLYRCARRRGPHASYECVAHWRPSSTGRPLEQRAPNLKISPKNGITDFGDGNRGYSPLDMVMAARSCSLLEATDWLEQHIGPRTGPDVDFDKIIEGPWPGSGQAEESVREEQPAEPQDGVRRRPVPPPSLGEAWYFGEPVPALPPMLVPGLLPRKGYGYLGGQWGTFKTFVTNDLAVAVASGETFAGQQVTMRGAVVQIELEGSHNELRVYAAAAARGVSGEELPIAHLHVSPPTIMINGRPNPAWPKWSKELAKYAREIAEYYGLPLALIIIDPQNRIAGFKDEQSSGEGQTVSNAWDALYRQADCLVLVVDHYGKDASAGLRGTSAKETNPLYVLGTGETKRDVYERRELNVRKMRNGISGLAVSFWMEDREVTIQKKLRSEDGVESVVAHTDKTLVIRWGDQLRPVGVRDDDGGGEVSKQQRRALAVLGELIGGGSGLVLPPECGATPGLRGTKLATWRLRLIDKTVIEGKNTSAAFSQIKNALLDRKEIDISHGFVWVPLP
jgi:AAA domain/Bifunctional DNA primase/polymerase, N-terminal